MKNKLTLEKFLSNLSIEELSLLTNVSDNNIVHEIMLNKIIKNEIGINNGYNLTLNATIDDLALSRQQKILLFNHYVKALFSQYGHSNGALYPSNIDILYIIELLEIDKKIKLASSFKHRVFQAIKSYINFTKDLEKEYGYSYDHKLFLANQRDIYYLDDEKIFEVIKDLLKDPSKDFVYPLRRNANGELIAVPNLDLTLAVIPYTLPSEFKKGDIETPVKRLIMPKYNK